MFSKYLCIPLNVNFTSGSQRMSFGNESTWRIDDVLSTVGVVTCVHHFAAFALSAEAQGLVGEQLVGAEAVVQFDDVNLQRL